MSFEIVYQDRDLNAVIEELNELYEQWADVMFEIGKNRFFLEQEKEKLKELSQEEWTEETYAEVTKHQQSIGMYEHEYMALMESAKELNEEIRKLEQLKEELEAEAEV